MPIQQFKRRHPSSRVYSMTAQYSLYAAPSCMWQGPINVAEESLVPVAKSAETSRDRRRMGEHLHRFPPYPPRNKVSPTDNPIDSQREGYELIGPLCESYALCRAVHGRNIRATCSPLIAMVVALSLAASALARHRPVKVQQHFLRSDQSCRALHVRPMEYSGFQRLYLADGESPRNPEVERRNAHG